jgi:hypothetical protein
MASRVTQAASVLPFNFSYTLSTDTSTVAPPLFFDEFFDEDALSLSALTS